MDFLLSYSRRLGTNLTRFLPYPTAHNEGAPVFSAMWLGFMFAFLVNVFSTRPPSSLYLGIILILIWLLLTPADLFLPSAENPLWFRILYITTETLLILSLTFYDSFSITNYWLFALVGQATLVLPPFLSIAYAGGMALLFHLLIGVLAPEAGGGLGPSIPWTVGAFFTWSVVSIMRDTIEKHRQVAELLEKLEAANKLVQAQAEELERQIKEDSLTGLANRRYLDMDLPREFERSRRYNKALSLAVADIDYFKNINDCFSHHVGDRVLVEIAGIFKQNCRASLDSVVRYGGEEFVFYFPETPAVNGSVPICERIRQAVENYDWNQVYPGLKVTISIGVAEAEPTGDYTQLLKDADAKMYEAKNKGRNQVCY